MLGENDRTRTPEGVFGAELRYHRERAGLSQTDLAALVNISHDVISKIETGERAPARDFPGRLDAVPELDTRGGLTRLWGWLKDSSRRGPYPGWFARWRDYEAAATALRTFQLITVPGLLQTAEYARAVLRTRVNTPDDEIEEMVEGRMARQAILTKSKPPMLWAVLTEAVLRCPVGGACVMGEQLNKLLDAGDRSNVIIQVVPTAQGAHEGFRGPFIIADLPDHPPVGYQDTAVQGQVVDSADDVAALMVLWDTIKSVALPAGASLELIEEVAKSWT